MWFALETQRSELAAAAAIEATETLQFGPVEEFIHPDEGTLRQ
jgi:hypothetical protein